MVALALAENSIGANAYKPKAWIPSAAGVVEISNTDAEGRLAMASAMTLVQRRYPNINKMLNIATLTGAQIVALGHYFAGCFTPVDSVAERMTAAGKSVHSSQQHDVCMSSTYDHVVASQFNHVQGCLGARLALACDAGVL